MQIQKKIVVLFSLDGSSSGIVKAESVSGQLKFELKLLNIEIDNLLFGVKLKNMPLQKFSITQNNATYTLADVSGLEFECMVVKKLQQKLLLYGCNTGQKNLASALDGFFEQPSQANASAPSQQSAGNNDSPPSQASEGAPSPQPSQTNAKQNIIQSVYQFKSNLNAQKPQNPNRVNINPATAGGPKQNINASEEGKYTMLKTSKDMFSKIIESKQNQKNKAPEGQLNGASDGNGLSVPSQQSAGSNDSPPSQASNLRASDGNGLSVPNHTISTPNQRASSRVSGESASATNNCTGRTQASNSNGNAEKQGNANYNLQAKAKNVSNAQAKPSQRLMESSASQQNAGNNDSPPSQKSNSRASDCNGPGTPSQQGAGSNDSPPSQADGSETSNRGLSELFHQPSSTQGGNGQRAKPSVRSAQTACEGSNPAKSSIPQLNEIYIDVPSPENAEEVKKKAT